MRRGILTTALAAAALVAAAPAAAAPAVAGEFPVSGVGTNNELVTGPDGNIWVTLDQTNDVAKITPEGVVTEYNPANVTNPVGIAPGPDGNLWVTQNGGVARFSPSDPNAAVSFAIGAIADARGITAGPDGNLWTASGGNVIRIPPGTPAGFTAFPVIAGARDITAGGDGNLWVADFGGARVVSVTTAGNPTNYDLGAGAGPQAITSGPGGEIAFADPTSNPHTVGRITAGGTPQKTEAPGDPFGVAYGADQAYWFPRFATGDLVRLSTAGDLTAFTGFSAGSGPRRISSGPNNTLWVTLELTNKVAKVAGVDPPVTDPPDTTPPAVAPKAEITSGPPDRAVEEGKRAKVKIAFVADVAGSTFECALKKKGKRTEAEDRRAEFSPCTSPKKYKRLRVGKYKFSVRATAAGLVGAPATQRFKVVEK